MKKIIKKFFITLNIIWFLVSIVLSGCDKPPVEIPNLSGTQKNELTTKFILAWGFIAGTDPDNGYPLGFNPFPMSGNVPEFLRLFFNDIVQGQVGYEAIEAPLGGINSLGNELETILKTNFNSSNIELSAKCYRLFAETNNWRNTDEFKRIYLLGITKDNNDPTTNGTTWPIRELSYTVNNQVTYIPAFSVVCVGQIDKHFQNKNTPQNNNYFTDYRRQRIITKTTLHELCHARGFFACTGSCSSCNTCSGCSPHTYHGDNVPSLQDNCVMWQNSHWEDPTEPRFDNITFQLCKYHQWYFVNKLKYEIAWCLTFGPY